MNQRILVVDDESVTRRLVTYALKSIQLETIAVGDGQAALQAARDHVFHLAIIDVNLPDIDGFTLIQQLKTVPHLRTIPMIIFTARNNADDQLLATESGAVGFLYKPFSTQELRDLVRKHLA